MGLLNKSFSSLFKTGQLKVKIIVSQIMAAALDQSEDALRIGIKIRHLEFNLVFSFACCPMSHAKNKRMVCVFMN